MELLVYTNVEDVVKPMLKNYNLENVDVKIIKSSKNQLILKKNNKVIAKMTKQSELPKFLNILENNTKEEFANREALERCGLPYIKPTSHCFTNEIDTCCRFGNYARSFGIEYNELPIISSEDAFEYRFGRKPNQTEKSNFCTTKEFCKNIADKFKDGTQILFTMDKKKIN